MELPVGMKACSMRPLTFYLRYAKPAKMSQKEGITLFQSLGPAERECFRVAAATLRNRMLMATASSAGA